MRRPTIEQLKAASLVLSDTNNDDIKAVAAWLADESENRRIYREAKIAGVTVKEMRERLGAPKDNTVVMKIDITPIEEPPEVEIVEPNVAQFKNYTNRDGAVKAIRKAGLKDVDRDFNEVDGRIEPVFKVETPEDMASIHEKGFNAKIC